MGTTILQDLSYFLPEITLAVTILAVILAEILTTKNKIIVPAISVLGLLVAMIFSLRLFGGPEHFIFSSMMIIDDYGLFFRIFFSIATILIIILSYNTFKRSGEYYVLLLGAVFGMYLMASVTHIVMIVLSLEIVGIACYVLAGFRRYELRSGEASLKYMLYGAVSTGVMLYGFSFLYGMTGEVNIYAIREVLPTMPSVEPLMLFISVLFIFAGLGYKIAMVPFHFWCPDVYEGSPTPVTTFFSVVPKVAGIALMGRFIFGGLAEQLSSGAEQWFPLGYIDLPFLIAIISVVTMTLGNLAALGQKNIKRMLAYSSIAHAGYILMGFTVFTGQGIKAILVYAIVYMFMNFGAFVIVDAIASRLKSEDISDYRGLGYRAPFLGAALTVFLLSLTGIPPTAGFIGKVMIFSAVINAKLYWLAVIGVLNSVVSLYYYFRIPKAMFLEKTDGELPGLSFSGIHNFLVTILLIPTLWFGIFWSPLLSWTSFDINFLVTIP
ncbi:NADH-quinone oxidoreductase subunit N [candidate division KSB1 bacterium]